MAAIPQMELWFESAFDYLNTHPVSVSKENKLKFYGYFKQATTGDCTIGKPNLFEFVARAKWDAWNALKGMEPEVAMLGYVELAERLAIGWTRDGVVEDYEPPAMTDNDQDPENTGHMMSSLAHGNDNDDDDNDDDNDDNGSAVIGCAKKNDLTGVREAVKEAKEPVNSVDAEGLTALHHASDRGYPDMVQLLFDLGADANARTTDTLETPLHYACISEQVATAQLLVDHGCDTLLQDAEGQSAFDLADASFLALLTLP
ncbi:hypothetical protein [Absidia glauca]|uniref:ACB domain-containing protein n=1 Tax=Absidia glauca TaxID=4829 RepID=A0A163JUK1_ABSGL|nr:hypothetical protein [Absidia glauca]